MGIMMAYFGLTSCKKKEEAPTVEPAAEAPKEEMSRKDMVKKMLIDKWARQKKKPAQ